MSLMCGTALARSPVVGDHFVLNGAAFTLVPDVSGSTETGRLTLSSQTVQDSAWSAAAITAISTCFAIRAPEQMAKFKHFSQPSVKQLIERHRRSSHPWLAHDRDTPRSRATWAILILW